MFKIKRQEVKRDGKEHGRRVERTSEKARNMKEKGREQKRNKK